MFLSAFVRNLCKLFHSRGGCHSTTSIREQSKTDTLYFALPTFVMDDYLYNLSHSYELAYILEKTCRRYFMNAEMYEITNGVQPIHYLVKYHDIQFKSHDRYIDIMGMYDSEDEFMNRYQFPFGTLDGPDPVDRVQLYKNFKMRKVTENYDNEKVFENQHKYYASIIVDKVIEFISRKHGNFREA